MPRKGYIAKREVLPDPIYNSKVVTKLINNVMLDGKKTVNGLVQIKPSIPPKVLISKSSTSNNL